MRKFLAWAGRRPWLQVGMRRMGTSFLESTVAQAVWERAQQAARRWAWWGAALGAALGAVAFAPAAWLADALASASGQRLLLADARGSVWSGSALPVLTGGPDSRDAMALPGRLAWRLVPSGMGLELRATQACCIEGEMRIRLVPGWGRFAVELLPSSATQGHWPAGWLTGLGTPWNTLQLAGTVRLSSPGLKLDVVQGRWKVNGRADLDLDGVSSRLSTLPALGSYRLSLQGDANSADAAVLNLQTREGSLLLNGAGQWTGNRMRFRGEAKAAEGAEGALNNLLNIIGRRQGALSVISIG